MTFINYASREINLKVVYYGPAESGKATNMQFIYGTIPPRPKSRVASFLQLLTRSSESSRGNSAPLCFDFVPEDLPDIRGFKLRFHLYKAPGQRSFNASRKLILKGVDGVIFVADSQSERMDANIESHRELEQNLESKDYSLMTLPYVLQLNKRDLPNIIPTDKMKAALAVKGKPVLEAIATSPNGIGVFDTLKEVAKLVLLDLRKPA
jgi:signal recognition particle receptor subunit beta